MSNMLYQTGHKQETDDTWSTLKLNGYRNVNRVKGPNTAPKR